MNRLRACCALLLVTTLAAAQGDTEGVLEEIDTYLDRTATQLGNSPFAAVVSRNGREIGRLEDPRDWEAPEIALAALLRSAPAGR